MHRLRRVFASGLHRFFLILFIGLFTTALVVSFYWDHGGSRPANESYRPAVLTSSASGSVQVDVGIFVNRIHDVDLSAGVFSANGWIWMSWKEEDNARWADEKPLDISVIDLINSVASSARLEPLTPRPTLSDRGRYWHEMRFSSVFLMQEIDYRRFPFEKIYLPIEIGTDDHPIYRLIYRPDRTDSMVSDRVRLSGYRFHGLRPNNLFYQAKTFWGHDVSDQDRAQGPLTYSQLEWELRFKRAAGASFVRLFLPLVSAMAALLFSLLANFKVAAQKVSIPASILLVLAVLQDRWHSVLPPGLSYLTYMDKLFIFAYVITVFVFAHSVYCVNRCHCAAESDQPGLTVLMRQHQRLLSSAISIALLAGPFLLWFV